MKLNYDEPLSHFAFNVNLRRSTEVTKALKALADLLLSQSKAFGKEGRGFHSYTFRLNLSHSYQLNPPNVSHKECVR